MKVSELIKKLQDIQQESKEDLDIYTIEFDGEKVSCRFPDLVEKVYITKSYKYQLKEGYPSKYVMIV